MTLQALSTAGRDDLLTIGAVPDHIVQFYDDEHFLCRAIGGFLARAMTSGQPLVVIATRPHLNAFQDDLRARGLDVVHGLSPAC